MKMLSSAALRLVLFAGGACALTVGCEFACGQSLDEIDKRDEAVRLDGKAPGTVSMSLVSLLTLFSRRRQEKSSAARTSSQMWSSKAGPKTESFFLNWT